MSSISVSDKLIILTLISFYYEILIDFIALERSDATFLAVPDSA